MLFQALLQSSLNSGLTVLALTLLTSIFVSRKWVPKWSEPERGFTMLPTWNTGFTYSIAAGTIMGATVGYLTGATLLGTMAGFVSYIFTMAALLDLLQMRVPYEFTRLGILGAFIIATALIASGYGYFGYGVTDSPQTDALLQWLPWVLLTVVYLFAAAFGHFGGADVNIMWMVGFAYAGFIGFGETAIFFLIGLLIQMWAFTAVKLKRRFSKKSTGMLKGGVRESLPLIPALAVGFMAGPLGYYLI